ncbi:MAG: hypothetical protein ACRDU9_03960 [Acidimicrobiia bacterium]
MVEGENLPEETPPGYRGRLPWPPRPPRPPRPPLAAQRWLINEARAEELRIPYRAEGLMVEAADRIHALVREGAWQGFGSCVLDYDHYSLTVYSKGPLPQEVEDLLHELRGEVSIDVHAARYSSDELTEEAHRISGLELPGLRITSVGPLRDCSGLRVTVDVGNDLARASREIESRMRLEFGVQPPPRLIPAGRS